MGEGPRRAERGRALKLGRAHGVGNEAQVTALCADALEGELGRQAGGRHRYHQDLARLDRYEGVAGGLYRREFVTVMAEDLPVELLLYIENYNDHGLPRPDYLERIIAGARWFDLPQAWIDDLAAIEPA